MPTPYLNKIYKESGIPMLKLEELWNEAKEAANKTHKESDSGYWGLVTTIFKKKVNSLLNSQNKPTLEELSMSLRDLSNFIIEDNNTVADVHLESELCFIGYMNNPAGLTQADRITEINQFVLRVGDKDNQIRVRQNKQVYPKEDLQYYCTIKKTLSKKQITVASEANERISKTFYENFQNLSNNESSKIRYTFRIKDLDIKVRFKDSEEVVKVPSLDFEVDVYSENSVMHEWVKVDIELDHLAEYIKYTLRDHDFSLSDCELSIPLDILPINLTNYFNSNMPDTEKEKSIKGALYDKGLFGKNK